MSMETTVDKAAAGGQFKRFVPITKIDLERRTVEGFLAEEAGDKSGEIFDYGTSLPFFKEWTEDFEKRTLEAGQEVSKGNLRAMHGSTAAGKFIKVDFDDEAKNIPVVAKVVDDSEWQKCLEGVYTGFSIGGDYIKRWKDEPTGLVRYTARPVEGSLVDNPCMYGATFQVVKADGAEELRKFVGAPAAEPPVVKDAVAAVGQANDAISALKALVAELALLPGEPDTWALENILEAIRGTVRGKIAAETAAATPLNEDVSPVPGGGPMEPKAAEPEVTKAAEPPAVAIVEPTDTLTMIGDFVEELGKAVQAAIEKAEPKTTVLTKEAVDALHKSVLAEASATLQKTLDTFRAEFAARLEKVESTPAAVGRPARPVDKALGSGTPDDAGASPATMEAVSKLIADAERTGAMTPQQAHDLRLAAAAAALKGLR